MKLIPHRLTPGVTARGIRSLVGFSSAVNAPSPSSALPPRAICPRLALKAFRGEPAISRFDWHFTSTHSSSERLVNLTGSRLHPEIIGASHWPWVAHQVSGLLRATKSPYSDSLSLRLRKSPCLALLHRVSRRLILQ